MGEKMDYRNRNQWIIDMNDELAHMQTPSDLSSLYWRKRSIYQIPAFVTGQNKTAYQPQLVSLGPYHHGSINLQPMEIHKRRAMLHFVKRSKKPLQIFFDALDPFVEELKDAYDQLGEEWLINNDAFLELMIVDGCFVLEVLRITSESFDQSTHDDDDSYDSNDPIFSEHGKHYIVPHLRTDMLMLENQLPLLVLEKLASLKDDEALTRRKNWLIRLILNFFDQCIPKKKLHIFDDNNLHLLGIYRKSLLVDNPPPIKKKTEETNYFRCWRKNDEDQLPHSATDLKEAGIVIKKSKTSSLKDISFKNGILRLPKTEVDDGLESLYLNLMAFECSHVGAGHEVSSYVCFMDSIIDSARDVSLLCSRRVMRNNLGSDKAVATLFNSLSKNVPLDEGSPLDEVRKKVDAYCQEPWHKWRANLVHTYFTNPWVGLSVVAAFFLFALATVQTVYTVLGYYKKTT